MEPESKECRESMGTEKRAPKAHTISSLTPKGCVKYHRYLVEYYQVSRQCRIERVVQRQTNVWSAVYIFPLSVTHVRRQKSVRQTMNGNGTFPNKTKQ